MGPDMLVAVEWWRPRKRGDKFLLVVFVQKASVVVKRAGLSRGLIADVLEVSERVALRKRCLKDEEATADEEEERRSIRGGS